MKLPSDLKEQERFYKAIHRLNGSPDFQLFKDLLTYNLGHTTVTLATAEGIDFMRAQGRYQFIEAMISTTDRDNVREVLSKIETNKK